MDKDTLKTIGWWVLALSVIALVSYGVHSCNKREDAEREAKRIAEEKEELQKLLSDKYVYKDINGVYHITKDCYRLDDYYWDKDDNKVIINYSSQYISRDSIEIWKVFAATHQLCSGCFTPKLIQQLDSALNTNKGWGVVSPYIQKDTETADERYRDADEEYYNMQYDYDF